MKTDKIALGFWYEFQHWSKEGELLSSERFVNLIPDAGRDMLINAGLQGGSQHSNFYIGIYTNDRTPLYTDTAVELSEYGEISTVDETERPLWNPSPLVNGVLESSANPAVFTASAEFTARGAFLVTTQPFGTNSGVLLSVAAASSPKVVETGEILRVPAGISVLT